MCITLPHNAAVILGRDATNELQSNYSLVPLDSLDAQRHGVSRQHCLIERRASGLTISDLGSTNGTLLNEHRLEQHRPYTLVHGDRLILGTLHLAIFFGAVDLPPAP
jgi:pSer/pThr/pTyr-binding forkhead associated (FHA) protein